MIDYTLSEAKLAEKLNWVLIFFFEKIISLKKAE